MLFDPKIVPYWRNCLLSVSLICLVCAGYAYRVNARRAQDDPNKRDFRFGASFLAPFTWPFLAVAYIAVLFARALIYSTLLITSLIALLVIRKPFLLIWLDKIATKIGNRLLQANTLIIRLFLGQPETVK